MSTGETQTTNTTDQTATVSWKLYGILATILVALLVGLYLRGPELSGMVRGILLTITVGMIVWGIIKLLTWQNITSGRGQIGRRLGTLAVVLVLVGGAIGWLAALIIKPPTVKEDIQIVRHFLPELTEMQMPNPRNISLVENNVLRVQAHPIYHVAIKADGRLVTTLEPGSGTSDIQLPDSARELRVYHYRGDQVSKYRRIFVPPRK